MKLTKLKRVASLQAGGTPPVGVELYWSEPPDGIPWVAIGDMSSGGVVEHTSRHVSEAGIADKGLPIGGAGTVVFAMYASLGAVAELGMEACWNQALLGIQPVPGLSDRRFIRYWLESLRPGLGALARSNTQDNLNAEQVGNLDFPMLPVESQRAIADYLDIETGRIDALISKKLRVIELQAMRFDTLVLETVLGYGAQPGPPWAQLSMAEDRSMMRLGTVLERRLERNNPIRLQNILSLTADRGVIPYEEKGDIGNRASEDISRYSIVRRGDIVLNSMNVIIGSVALSRYEGVLSPVYYVLKPVDGSEVDMRFLAYHFRIREFQRQLIRLGHGILDHRMRIPWINLKSEKLILPPLDTQRIVANKLDRATDRTKHFLGLLQRSLDLLNERRQALITAAVTRQIAISGVAA